MKEKTPSKKRKVQILASKVSSGSALLPTASPKTTSKADILISIKPVYMDRIVARKKDHEFRNYLISKSIQRMWLYVSSPDQTLRYIAVVSEGKSPGEIEDEDGMGNADFNARLTTAVAGYAYEIKELYQLQHPLPLVEMQRTYGVTFPQRFAYVVESMVKDIVLEDQIRLF